MNKFKSWETHFSNTESNENFHYYEGNQKYSIKSTLSHLYLCHCTFTNVTETSIRYSSTSSSLMLVELCSFNTCSTGLQHGGAICFSDQGQCVLSSVCGVKCYTGSGRYFGQFCYVYVTNNQDNKNHIIDSSVTLTKQTNAHCTLYLLCGNVSCKGVNVSNNEVNQFSGIEIDSPSICSISYSSFRNNTATYYVCICCDEESQQEMSYSNIIDNNQESSSYGIIYTETSTNLTMIHCSVYGNCNSENGTVFYAYSGTSIACTYCSMTEDKKTSKYETVIYNEEPPESFINYYKYLELNECKRGLDEWSNIKPITPISNETSKICVKCFTLYIFILFFLWYDIQ